jgi:hypothetical protein
MAIIALSTSRRWFGKALRGRSRTTTILIVMILAGAVIAIWARTRIDALLTVDDGAEIVLALTDIKGDCGTPSVYMVPEPDGSVSRYRLLVDFLGGPNRFPMLGGGNTVPVLSLPESRPPGIGVGRGLPQTCEFVALSISGQFTRHRFEQEFPGVSEISQSDAPYMTRGGGEGGDLFLTYRKPVNPYETAALVAVTLEDVADRWQQGSRRIALINRGQRDINVFVHEEAGYQFVNAQDALVRPVGVRRAYVDVHLAAPGGRAENSAVVYRRSPTADIELQHDLVGISTIFGIGVSLLVEGVIVLVISLAAAGGQGNPRVAGEESKPNETSGNNRGTHEQL